MPAINVDSMIWLLCAFCISAACITATQTAIVCEGWCHPSGVCKTTGNQCICNQSSVLSTCRYRLLPDTGAPCSGKCHNGGTCIVHNGLAMCVCTSDFYGSLCQYVRTDICLKGCLNGATCQTLLTDTMNQTEEVCVCSSRFYGDLCQLNATDCPEPCLNGGVCQDGYCVCTQHFTGSRCHLAKSGDCSIYPSAAYFDESEKHPRRLSPGNIAAIVMIALSTVGLSVGVRYYKKWKIKRHRRRNPPANQSSAPNNRAWIERNSAHPGVNFVQIPDLSSVQPPSTFNLTRTSSDASGAQQSHPINGASAPGMNLIQDGDSAMATPGEMPPPYESVVDYENSFKSNVRYQELNCRNLDDA
ncbi:neurogenic locus protein delta-like [Ptychodera flava]|uniref:neurogenic locus protein delta-like n=1 Tax=Ptychodera flava TaxID=63121 RepID=UPI00396A41AB